MRIQRGFAARPLIPVRRRLAAALTTAGAIGVLAVVDVANASPGLVMDGRSLIPVAANPAIERNRALLVEEPTFEAIRTERYVYAEHSSGERELYDLQNDPFELVSRHDDPRYALVEAPLAERLHQFGSCAGDSCRVHQADPSPLG